jgi:hypothetical protein
MVNPQGDSGEQISKARAGLMDGPPVLLPPFDVEDVVRGWRERRA